MLGIREYARRAGAQFGAVTEAEVEAWLAGGAGPCLADQPELPAILQDGPQPEGPQLGAAAGGRRQLAARAQPQAALSLAGAFGGEESGGDAAEAEGLQRGSKDELTFNLFAFPALDNFGGVGDLSASLRALD